MLLTSLRRLRLPVAFVVGFVAGIATSVIDAGMHEERSRQMRYLESDQFTIIEGSVVDIPRCEGDRCSTALESVRLTQAGREVETPHLILESVGGLIPAGDYLRAEGTVKASMDPPRASIKSARLMTVTGSAEWWRVPFFRKRIEEQLGRAGGDDRGRRLVEAIALGDRESLSTDRKKLYRDAGVYHLLVFSGMQITIAAMLILAMVRTRRMPRTSDWMLLLLSLAAPAIAGGSPSVTRASMMIGIDAFSRIIHRPTSYANILFVSAALQLMVAPGSIDDPSFLLTYTATAGLVLVAGSFNRGNGATKILRISGSVIATELVLSAITRYFFHQWTLGSSIVTLLLSPVFTLILILSFLSLVAAFVFPTLVPPLLLFIAETEELILRFCGWLTAKHEFIRTDVPPSLTLLIASFACAAVVLAMVPARFRFLAALPFLFGHLDFAEQRPAESYVAAFDVGQGDAILVSSPAAVVLVDAGPPPNGMGLPMVMKRLAKFRIRSIDALVISHAHPDHCGGAATVLRFADVARLIVPRTQLSEPCIYDAATLAARRGTRLVLVGRGEDRTVGSVRVAASRFRFKRSILNNESLIVSATVGTQKIVLAGDLEKEGERFWSDELPSGEKVATILKIAHHGSATSTTDRFLSDVRPRMALISAGRRNTFGHPHPTVLARLAAAGVRVERTDRSGDIVVRIFPRTTAVSRQFDSPY